MYLIISITYLMENNTITHLNDYILPSRKIWKQRAGLAWFLEEFATSLIIKKPRLTSTHLLTTAIHSVSSKLGQFTMKKDHWARWPCQGWHGLDLGTKPGFNCTMFDINDTWTCLIKIISSCLHKGPKNERIEFTHKKQVQHFPPEEKRRLVLTP